MQKVWWSSKTLWLGVTAVLLAISDAVLNGLGWRGITIAAIGALVVVLRAITGSSLTMKRK